MSRKVEYIQGLRAISLLLVLVFHIHPDWLPSGYLGVDAFFAISGYVITRLIFHQLLTDSFSFREFYLSRALKLLPNLFVTISLTVVAFSFLYGPSDLLALSKSALAASFSISNIYFFSEAGYFSDVSKYKPLLHTWSLGVEEQFYLLWPVCIVLLLSTSIRSVRFLSIITVLLTSTTFFAASYSSDLAFFLSPFRANQFVVGALFFVLSRDFSISQVVVWRPSVWRSVIPGMLIGLSLFEYSVGLQQAIAQFSTSLICAIACMLSDVSARSSSRSKRSHFMESRLSVFIGNISYSVYLVHWPLILFVGSVSNRLWFEYSDIKIVVFVFSILSGWALHSLMGTMFPAKRNRVNSSSSRQVVMLGLTGVLCILISSTMLGLQMASFSKQGAGVVTAPELKKMVSEYVGKLDCEFNLKRLRSDYLNELKRCSDRDGTNILVIGDSLSLAQRSALSDAGTGVRISRVFVNGCPPYFGREKVQLVKMQRYLEACRGQNDFVWSGVLELISSKVNFDYVVVSGNWHTKLISIQNHNQSFRELSKVESKIVVVGLQPFYIESVPRLFEERRLMISQDEDLSKFLVDVQVGDQREYNKALEAEAKSFPRINFLDIFSVLCELGCRPVDSEKNSLYTDRNHLSLFGARYISQSRQYQLAMNEH